MIHQTKPYWNTQNLDKPHYLALKKEKQFDVAIIGGGIAGLSTAMQLKQSGKSVLLLEQYSLASADSGRTTAHITDLLDTRYSTIKSKFGKEKLKRVISAVRFANETIEQWINRWNISCDYEQVPGFLYTSTKGEVDQLKREADLCQEEGLDAHWEPNCPLPFSTQGSIRIEDQAQFHPTKYLFALARQINGDGSAIIENTPVVEIKEGQPCHILTPRGEFLAQEVVLATHSPIKGLFIHTKIAAYRTYTISAHLEMPPTMAGLFWDTDTPYHYIRPHKEDWIIGGEDHKTGKNPSNSIPFDKLIEFSNTHFSLKSVSHRWSGQILDPIDGLPFIGRSAGSKHIYIATGFSGNGMTFGTLSGLLLSDLILNKENRWTELFSPSRFEPISSSRRYISENKDYPICLIKDRLDHRRAEEKTIEPLPEEGKVIQQNGEFIAVYCSKASKIFSVSAVCPHLGCLVHFNSIEQSWDCPCHGSRFSPDGSVLNGPSAKNLEPMKVKFKTRRKSAA